MNSTKKIYFLEMLMFFVLVFNSFVLNIFNYSIVQVVFFLILLLLSFLILGFEKEKVLYDTVGILQNIFIYSFFYLLFIYAIGLITGYLKTIYNLQFIGIIKNILPVFFLLVFQELFRYQIVKKAKAKNYKTILGFLILLFVFFDIRTAFFQSYTAESLLNLFSTLLFPSIAKNLFLTYLVYKTGYKETIFYQVISELILFVVPIYPDLGMYLTGIAGILKPFILFLILRNSTKKGIEFYMTSRKGMPLYVKIFITFFLIVVIMLVSGLFKYYALCLVSNSMFPELKRGDVIIVSKKEAEEIRDIEVGEVLVYNMHDRVVVHRIVDKVDNKENFYFKTKGDANDDVDTWAIYENNVIGVAKYKIPYIGYPSVWFSELGDD